MPFAFSPRSELFRLLRVCGVVLMLACAFYNVGAQTVVGRISGTIKDATGAVIPGATVSVTNASTNLVRTATADGEGFYTLTNLPVGTYTVSAESQGFKRAEQAGVALTADARLTIDLMLEPGQVTETVQVASALGETVNTTSGEVARVIDGANPDAVKLDDAGIARREITPTASGRPHHQHDQPRSCQHRERVPG